MTIARFTNSCLALWLLFSAAAWGQMVGTATASLASEDRSPFFNNLSLEPVGPGDLLYISVTNWTEVTRSYRIAQDGTITFPVLKQSVSVSGLSAPEIEKACLDAVIGEPRVDLPVERADDLGRRVPGRADTGPRACLVSRHELGNARNIRQGVRACCGAQCQRAIFQL